jgi:hypothetical protein
MNAGVSFRRIWSDDDVVELEASACDGTSMFCTRVYVDHGLLESTVSQLHTFKHHVHGGLYDLEFGRFGPEYASGAVHMRLYFYPPGRGRLCVTVRSEGEWGEFSRTEVASSATLYFKTEPGLLDSFIEDLGAVAKGTQEEAVLRGA